MEGQNFEALRKKFFNRPNDLSVAKQFAQHLREKGSLQAETVEGAIRFKEIEKEHNKLAANR
ncbi:MAG TPA: hypothetical protein DF383_08340, partial [Deltaproteobacteria bacterium]|nr:hypothetical protein [Deltaproteobacteria bacterium]